MWHFFFGISRVLIGRKKTDLNITNCSFDTHIAEIVQFNDSHNKIDSFLPPCSESETEFNKLVSSHDNELL